MNAFLDWLFALFTAQNSLNISIYGEWAQNISFILGVVLLLSSIQWIRANPDKWGYEIPTLLLTIHFLVFYVVVLVIRDSVWLPRDADLSYIFTNWSVALRLQTLLTLVTQARLRMALTNKRGKVE